LEVAQRDRQLPIRIEAFDVVDPVALELDPDEPAVRAAPDPMGGEVRGIARRDRLDGQGQGHRRGSRLARSGGPAGRPAGRRPGGHAGVRRGETSTGRRATTTEKRY